MDVTYILKLALPPETATQAEWQSIVRSKLDQLRMLLEQFHMETIRVDDYYGVIIVKGTIIAVQNMYGITLTHDPRKEALGSQFPQNNSCGPDVARRRQGSNSQGAGRTRRRGNY